MNLTMKAQVVLDEMDRSPGDVLLIVRDALEGAHEEGLADEAARIRRELLAWIGSREEMHVGNVALALLRNLRGALNEIIPEP